MSGIVGNNTARASGVIAGASADFVKIATVEVTGSVVSSIDIQGCFTSTYDNYQIHFNRLNFDGGAYLYPVMLDDSNAAITSQTYYTKGHYLNNEYNNDTSGSWNANNASGFDMSMGYNSESDPRSTSGIIYFPDPRSTRTPGDGYKTFWWTINGAYSGQFWRMDGICFQSANASTPYGGIQFKPSAGDNIKVGFKATVYGLKT